MDILIHDVKNLNERILSGNGKNNITVISDNGKIHPCICCFGCWIKTPGQCVIAKSVFFFRDSKYIFI